MSVMEYWQGAQMISGIVRDIKCVDLGNDLSCLLVIETNSQFMKIIENVTMKCPELDRCCRDKKTLTEIEMVLVHRPPISNGFYPPKCIL